MHCSCKGCMVPYQIFSSIIANFYYLGTGRSQRASRVCGRLSHQHGTVPVKLGLEFGIRVIYITPIITTSLM